VSWRGRLGVAVCLSLAVLAAGGLTSPPARAVGPCTDVQIIGLRGSGENPPSEEQHDMGKTVGPVADLIAEQAQAGSTVSFYGVPYPAESASVFTVLDQKYFASKKTGEQLLHQYLLAEIGACPSTKLVVIGYSQGAHAAGDDLADEPSSVTNHVAAFVMFGDPRFNPAARYDWGTFDPRDHGLAGARSLGDFGSWQSRVYSFCTNGDLICQGIGFGHGTDQHKHYVELDGALVAGLVRRALGWPRPTGAITPLDLAFVIDSTGSMGSSIGGVENAAKAMVNTLESKGADYRVGLVDYKDTDQGDPYAARVDLNMTKDAPAFSSAVGALTASGGGDTPEAVYSGIMTAINGLSWRNVPRKAIIVMGDAAAKDPEPITGYTHASVIAAARALDPAVIDPIAIGAEPLASFTTLAEGSGGTVFEAADPSAVSEQVLAVVEKAATPLYTSLTVGTPAKVGSAVEFSAAGSYYDAGEITSYDWDFNGDGIIDEETPENHTSHIYLAPYDGDVSVTVHTDDDQSATSTAELEVADTIASVPSPPRGLTVTEGPDHGSLKISWEVPQELGGEELLGYQAAVVDEASGTPVYDAALSPAETEADVTELPAGTYRVTITALTAAGQSEAAELSKKIGSGGEELHCTSATGSMTTRIGKEARSLTNSLSTNLTARQNLALRFGRPAHRLTLVTLTSAQCIVEATKAVFTGSGLAKLDGQEGYFVNVRLVKRSGGRFAYRLRLKSGHDHEVVSGAAGGVAGEEIK
jgi:Cutinase/von Willebrand factor type A domain/PKD domain/Fibronectin type III domain